MSTPPVKYVCVASSLFISSVCTEVPQSHKMPNSNFPRQGKKRLKIKKKPLPERKRVKEEEKEEKKKKKKSSWVQLNGKRADRVYVASSCSVRLFLATVGARSSGFGGSLVSSWGTTTEQSRWRIITGLIASAPLTHPHLLKGDPWGFLLLSRSQRSPVLPLSRYDGCARLWPSPLTCVFIPNHSSACRGRIIHSDITMERKTHKVNINLLIFNSNSAAGQMARF